jgi:hypothetical protein
MEILLQHLKRAVRKTMENFNQDSRCSGQNSNWEPTKCNSRMLPLHFPARAIFIKVIFNRMQNKMYVKSAKSVFSVPADSNN